MRKTFLFMMITADGYFEGPGHDISWHNVDSEFNGFAVRQLEDATTLAFGRRTYELMASFWPNEKAVKADDPTAKKMNSYQKIVFSRSLQSVNWQNSTLHHGHVAEVFDDLKKQPGKDIAVLGSSNLCLTLLEDGLLDEVRLMVNPIVLGQGTSLFDGLKTPHRLLLQKSTNFKSGNVLLTYQPAIMAA